MSGFGAPALTATPTPMLPRSRMLCAVDLALRGELGETRIGRQHHIALRAFGDALGDGARGAEFEFHRVAGFLLVGFDQFAHHRLHRAGAEHHDIGGHRRRRNQARKNCSKKRLTHVGLPSV